MERAMDWLFPARCWVLFSWSLSGPPACGKSRASASTATNTRTSQPRLLPTRMAREMRAKSGAAQGGHADNLTRPWPKHAVYHRFGIGIHRRKDSDFDARKQDDHPEKR